MSQVNNAIVEVSVISCYYNYRSTIIVIIIIINIKCNIHYKSSFCVVITLLFVYQYIRIIHDICNN